MNGLFISTRLNFYITNTGRVAAYKWQLVPRQLFGYPKGYEKNYSVGKSNYPDGFSEDSYILADDTILPSCLISSTLSIGFWLTSVTNLYTKSGYYDSTEIFAEFEKMIDNLAIEYQIAMETSVGELQTIALRKLVDIFDIVDRTVRSLKFSGQDVR